MATLSDDTDTDSSSTSPPPPPHPPPTPGPSASKRPRLASHSEEQAVPDDTTATAAATFRHPHLPAPTRPAPSPSPWTPTWDAAIANLCVNRRQFRRVGPYLLGQRISGTADSTMCQYLGKREGGDTFVLLKIVTLSEDAQFRQEQHLARMLLHTELSVLRLLVGVPGVQQSLGLLTDAAHEERAAPAPSQPGAGVTSAANRYTGRICRRLVLVLECAAPHEFCRRSGLWTSLHAHLERLRKLSDRQALQILRNLAAVMERCHQRDVVHGDLRLANVQLNRYTNRVMVQNWGRGQHLEWRDSSWVPLSRVESSSTWMSPYMGPELLARPDAMVGRAADVWSMGVMLYVMVFGQYPFVERTAASLVARIKAADYSFPITSEVSYETIDLIRGMLVLNAAHRLTAAAVRQRCESILIARAKHKHRHNEQIVPQISPPPITTSSTLTEQQFGRLFDKPAAGSPRSRPDDSARDQLVPTSKRCSHRRPNGTVCSSRLRRHHHQHKGSQTFGRPTAADIYVHNLPFRPAAQPMASSSPSTSSPSARLRSRPSPSFTPSTATLNLSVRSLQTPSSAASASARFPPLRHPDPSDLFRRLSSPAANRSQSPQSPESPPPVQPPPSPSGHSLRTGNRAPPPPAPQLRLHLDSGQVQRTIDAIFGGSMRAANQLPTIPPARSLPAPLPPPEPPTFESFERQSQSSHSFIQQRLLQINEQLQRSAARLRTIQGVGSGGSQPAASAPAAPAVASLSLTSRIPMSPLARSPLVAEAAAPLAPYGSAFYLSNADYLQRPTGQLVPFSRPASTIALDEPLLALFFAISEAVINRRMPTAPRGPLLPFDGRLLPGFSTKVVELLLRHHGADRALQAVMGIGGEGCSAHKVRMFLRRFDVMMDVVAEPSTGGDVVRLRARQSVAVQLLLKWLMHGTGYDESYFVYS